MRALPLLLLAACAANARAPSSNSSPFEAPSAVDELPPSPVESTDQVVAAPAESGSALPVATPAPSAPPPMKELLPPETETVAALVEIDPRYRTVAEHVAAQRWRQAKQTLDVLVAAEPAGHRLDVTLAERALSGSLAARAGLTNDARTAYAAVLDGWKNPRESVQRITSEVQDAQQVEVDHRLALALLAVGQATYSQAETLRIRAAGIVFPTFRGPRTMKPILAFINGKVHAWIIDKQKALDAAEAAYRKVVEIEPVAPPRWVMDSAERVGTMWMDFVDDFRKAPVPKELEDRPEVRAQYEGTIADSSSAILHRALDAYRVCVEWSEKYRIEDDQSRVCRSRLAAAKTE